MREHRGLNTMTIIRGLAAGVAFAGAAIGLAGPASADPASGNYTGTMVDGGGRYEVGDSKPWTINPCGPDCISAGTAGSPQHQLHRQGNLWIGDYETLDENTLIVSFDPPSGEHFAIKLAKDA
jgi:hypothetical protein